MNRLRAFLVAILVVFGAVAAGAIDVSPLRIVLSPDAGRTSATFTVTNPRPNALPVEMSMERRVIAPDGTQTFVPVDEDFIIFPMQTLIPAGASQAVRVQYIGDTDVGETQGYVLRVSEVPVQEEGFSGIQFAYAFGAAVYVKPDDAEARIRTLSWSRQGNTVTAELVNEGNDFALLFSQDLRVQIAGRATTFERETLTPLIPNALVAPGATRTLVIELDGLPEGEIERFQFL